MTHKTLTIIRGLPGSGKSTLAQQVRLSLGNAFHYEADMYYGAHYDWSPEKHKEAHKWCQDRVRMDMAQWKVDQIIVSNTFTQKWEMKYYEDMAKEFGYAVQYVHVYTGLTDAELALRTIHKVPVEAITKMRNRWEP